MRRRAAAPPANRPPTRADGSFREVRDHARGAGAVPQIDRREIAAIFIGGAAGSLLRVLLATELPARVATWPWATFIVNVSGCFALGLIATHLRERPPE